MFFDDLVLTENLCSEYFDISFDFSLQNFKTTDLIVRDSPDHENINIVKFIEFRYGAFEVSIFMNK